MKNNEFKAAGKIAYAAVVTGLAFIPAAVHAEEMTLTSADNTVSISGEYVGFRNEAYIIIYRGQELHVPADLMTCDGPDCLNFESVAMLMLTNSES